MTELDSHRDWLRLLMNNISWILLYLAQVKVKLMNWLKYSRNTTLF